MPTIFAATDFSGNSRPRRLKIAELSECKSRLADRRVVRRESQTGSAQTRTALGVQVSPGRPIWNVKRTSEPGLGANEWVPSGKWCFAIREANVPFGETDWQDLGSPLHGIPPSMAGSHQCAHSSKRAGGLIPRIALDQCRVPERYRMRAPVSWFEPIRRFDSLSP